MSDQAAETRQHGLLWTKCAGSTEWAARAGAFSAFVLDEEDGVPFRYDLTLNVNGHVLDVPHNLDDRDDRPRFGTVDEAMLGAERAIERLGVPVNGASQSDAAKIEQEHNRLVADLTRMLGGAPSEIIRRVRPLVERSGRRGAVSGDLLPQIGQMFAHARTLAQFVLDGDPVTARELALGILGKAAWVEKTLEAGSLTGFRGWWATVLAESAAQMLRSDHEALLSAAMDLTTREGPVAVIIRRGRASEHTTATELRNTELTRRVDAMAKLLDSFVGWANAMRAVDEIDLDELDRAINRTCDEWSALSTEMKRSPVGDAQSGDAINKAVAAERAAFRAEVERRRSDASDANRDASTQGFVSGFVEREHRELLAWLDARSKDGAT